MTILIELWLGAFAATAILAPESFGRFADNFWDDVCSGVDWLLGRR